MLNRRKPCDIEVQKDQYEAHIKKLQVLKSKNSPFHRSLAKERREVQDLIRNSHKLHKGIIQSEIKNRQITEVQTQRKDYDTIPSILKRELSRKILSIPAKQKPDSYLRDIANIQMVKKILNVKSQFNFKELHLQNIYKTMRPKLRSDLNEDYSQIYEHSSINMAKKKKIYVKMEKSNQNILLVINFQSQKMTNFMKNSNLYAILIKNGQKYKKSAFFMLSDFLQSEIVLEIAAKDTTIMFLQNIGQKQINRFKISFDQSQLNFQNIQRKQSTKIIQDMKNRTIGLAQIQIKQKKIKRISKKDKLKSSENYHQQEQSENLNLNKH